MTYFEAVGVDYQFSATNLFEAKKYFAKSCNKCIHTGKHIDCDKCAISNAHHDLINILRR